MIGPKQFLERDLPLVHKIMSEFVKRYRGLEYEDLFSEACIIYLQAIRHYDPSRGAWSTFVWVTIHNHLQTLVKRERRQKRKEREYSTKIVLDWIPHEPTPEQQYIAQENWCSILESLSPNAQAICQILLEESDMFWPTNKPRKCRGILFRLLREQGWSWNSVWNGFREIRQALRT